MNKIRIKNITKHYGKFCALENINLAIEEHKIVGLLGRNGAGKTTLLNLVTNRIFPNEGEILIDNENVCENDRATGKVYYMTEKTLYPESMKINKIFKWTKEFYPAFSHEYALALCEKFGLDPKKKISSLSTGYNTIFKLITALASNAEILLLDEPGLGLDANHRDLFYKELLDSYIKKPKTIMLSTHIIEEIADIIERVVIINQKTIAIDQSKEELIQKAYCVSGSAEHIEKYIQNKKCIAIDQMASYKSAAIFGSLTDQDKNEAKKLNLEFSKVGLQKLFIHLTSEGGVK